MKAVTPLIVQENKVSALTELQKENYEYQAAELWKKN